MNKNKGSRFINLSSNSLKRNPRYSKGFTLIELLVVIAIIGVLTSIVLATVGYARKKAEDAVVRGDMANIRTQADIWYGENGNLYNTSGSISSSCSAADTFFVDAKINDFVTQIGLHSDPASVMNCYITEDGNKWSMSISTLKGGGSWCIDNGGFVNSGVAQDTGLCL
jgi:prepilin-type N-terminal cleavage/methylation domain-containing protein